MKPLQPNETPRLDELEDLRARLQEAEDTLRAIRNDEIDALVVETRQGEQVYTLRSADQPYRIFVEKMQEGAVTLTRDGLILYCNQHFTRMVGTPLETTAGSSFFTFLDPGDIPAVAHLLETADGSGRLECMLQPRVGAPVPIGMTASRFDDEAAEGICVVVTDLTEQRRKAQMEAEETVLRAMNDALEQRVVDRTAELTRSQEQLRQSERLASLGTLASGIAHEINNPLNSILLSAQYVADLYRELSGDELHEAMVGLVEEARRCGRIVRRLLEFARDQIPTHWQTDLNEMVTRCAHRIHAYSAGCEVSLETSLAEQLPKVDINPTDMEQVLLNLIQNACQAAKNAVRIQVSTEACDTMVQLTVQDDGPGISHEDLKHIFDPFFTTRREQGGTGLGLSIVHGVVNRCHGHIEVDSSPGEGTRITVALPALTEDDQSCQSTLRDS